MNRPIKVTVVGISILALSALALIATMIAAIMASSTRIEHQGTAIVVLGVSAAGILTGSGVLRLKSWARQLVLVVAGLFAFIVVILAPVILFFNVPGDSGIPALAYDARAIVVALCFAVAIIGLCCAQVLYVQAEAFEATPPRPAFSIAAIGFFLLLSGTVGAGGLFNLQQPPTITFGIVLTGWKAFAVLLFYSAVSLSLGIGLLTGHAESRRITIYYAFFQILNNGVFLVRPDRQDVVNAFYDARALYNPAWAAHLSIQSLAGFLRFWSTESCILALLALWLLSTRKSEVEQFAK